MSAPGVETAAGYATALASLPGMGPATLVALLTDGDPSDAWRRVREGEIRRPEPRRSARKRPRRTWRELAGRVDPAALASRCEAAGIQVTWWGDNRYPTVLRGDPEPPGVFFWRGDLSCLDRPCVALVGTRRATADGRATAFEMGRDLAAAGVCVVSGLALGIDGAAHTGALAMPEGSTVGVAASGVDVAYPRRHVHLWELVVDRGAVCSETPPGQPAQAWRFPSRNRVIAGLSRLVVVVESHASGGSMLTVAAALARGIDVAVVPGPVRSPASAGTNRLLTEGPAPVRHAGDVLDLLGRVAPWPPPHYEGRPRRLPFAPRADRVARGGGGRRPGAGGAGVVLGARPRGVESAGALESVGAVGAGGPAEPVGAVGDGGLAEAGGAVGAGGPAQIGLSAEAGRVLDAVAWRSTSLNRVAEVSGLAVGVVAGALDELEAAGLVAAEGSWWRRVPAP